MLYESAETTERPPIASETFTFSASMSLRQQMIGLASCRAFEQVAGHHLAERFWAAMQASIEEQ